MRAITAKNKFKRLIVNSKKNIGKLIVFILILALAAIVMLPIWWIFRSSLMTNSELYTWPPLFFPKEWRFSNYIRTLEVYEFLLYLGNTAKIIVPSVFGGTFTAALSAYAFARLQFKGKKLIFSLCVGSMLVPNTVTLIPLYLMWTKALNMGDSFGPLIIPYFMGGGAFNIFLIRQFLMTIPRELDEAATIDGASKIQILYRIILPLIRPVMISVGLFIFIAIWNDLLQQTIYINSPSKFTIAIGLSMFRSGLKADWAKIMCATCLSFVPGLIIFSIGQRYFVEGITMTGLKN